MMPLSEIFLFGIILYVGYRFVFNFFLPVYRTTKHIRQQFRNMQDPRGPQPGSPNEAQPGGTQQNGSSSGKPAADTPKNTMGEYIDFEEIK
jgi:hypothetical protein